MNSNSSSEDARSRTCRVSQAPPAVGVSRFAHYVALAAAASSSTKEEHLASDTEPTPLSSSLGEYVHTEPASPMLTPPGMSYHEWQQLSVPPTPVGLPTSPPQRLLCIKGLKVRSPHTPLEIFIRSPHPTLEIIRSPHTPPEIKHGRIPSPHTPPEIKYGRIPSPHDTPPEIKHGRIPSPRTPPEIKHAQSIPSQHTPPSLLPMHVAYQGQTPIHYQGQMPLHSAYQGQMPIHNQGQMPMHFAYPVQMPMHYAYPVPPPMQVAYQDHGYQQQIQPASH